MKIIDILDLYIAGDSTTANNSLEQFIDSLVSSPNQHVHPLLMNFFDKELTFRELFINNDLDSLEEHRCKLTDTADLYLWALGMMKAHNPATTEFVTITKQRLLS